MRPCVKKAASGDFGDRKVRKVWRGNADLTLPGDRVADKARAPIVEGPDSVSAAARKLRCRKSAHSPSG